MIPIPLFSFTNFISISHKVLPISIDSKFTDSTTLLYSQILDFKKFALYGIESPFHNFF